ncbi:chorismate mutase [Streptomyces marincola]|uniref:Chorismate mutase n=1 Tax=Streptomyces marincola TaxID=2878388 RepID=A0A1W7CWD2_9ACTN|nr:chorismate mutase [Streptomyces marincola]ARQ68989.1 chorismate mutase [Streptomyces marincola]
MTATTDPTTPSPSPAPDAPADGAAERSPEEVIATARARIDDLDARIIGLIEERVTVSRQVQAARIASGGRRVHLAREMDILRRYRDGLGAPGTGLAMTLLDLCRGRA